MLELPANLSHYKSTPIFTEQTAPASLLKDHSTKAGTWGVLTVESGRLKYVVTESGYEEELLIEQGCTAIIAPQHKHYVEPCGAVSFYVAFYH